MENIVYSKSEFFDSINSSYNAVLKKPLNLSWTMKKPVKGRSGGNADKSQRQFQK